mmetsp:Transcript_1725/g.6144  ORF Transcript_1725/g.6144 Transcript_1725/m.6144 type:complete len:624 (+) Transcript_1725:32-1903(+)
MGEPVKEAPAAAEEVAKDDAKSKERRRERRRKEKEAKEETDDPVEEDQKESRVAGEEEETKRRERKRSKKRRERRKDAENDDDRDLASPKGSPAKEEEEKTAQTDEEEDEGEDQGSGGSQSSSRCTYCQSKFGILRQKRRCRMCESNCCSDCCSVRVSYPPPYTFKGPKLVCNDCLPKVFTLRSSLSTEPAPLSRSNDESQTPAKKNRERKRSKQLSKSSDGVTPKAVSEKKAAAAEEQAPSAATASPSTPSLVKRFVSSPMLRRKRSSSAILDGSFHTAGDQQVHTAFRMADPVCRLMFRVSGMYEGGTFDRSTLSKAMKVKTALKYETVGSVDRMFVPVPALVKEDGWTLACAGEEPPADDEEQWHDMPVFVFKPKGYDGVAPLPVVLWYHGGGFCIGSIEDQMYQTICRRLCNMIGCIVVSVEYRLAPEFKFPHAIEDSYRALCWVHKAGKEKLNADVDRIAVAGDSAGGSISALMSVMTRDRKGPKLTHQALVYPCLADPCNDEHESQVKYKNGPILTRRIMTWFMEQVVSDPETMPTFLFPLLFDDISGLPDATIINALHDPLYDHGILYFKKLKEAGVNATHTTYRSSIHGFFGSQIGESDEAVMEMVMALRKAFKL